MWGDYRWCRILLLVTGLTPGVADSQSAQWKTFVSAENGKFTCSESVEYALNFSGLFLFNWSRDNNTGNFTVTQNLRYNWWIENRKRIRFSSNYVHNLGMIFYSDSISRFNADENVLTTRLDIPFGSTIFMTISSVITTGFFNAYDYRPQKVLSASFMTPFTGNLSAGFSWKKPDLGSVTLGLSSLKITWIMNRDIYIQQGTGIYRGVPESEPFLPEYGISLQIIADRDLLKWIHWYCDVLIFKDHDSPWDLSMKNQFALRITRFLKLNLQSRMFYEEDVSKKLQAENLISAGLSIKF